MASKKEVIFQKKVSDLIARANRLEDEEVKKAIRLLADTFDVNPVVAKIRLDGLYPVS